MYNLIVVPAAAQMARDAYEWYEEQLPGLGGKFLKEVEKAFNKIERRPAIYSIIKRSYRQVKLSTFPYVIVFEIMGDTVVVFSIFHTSRHLRKKFGL